LSNLASLPFVILAGVMLLAIIPAFLLFKLLPSTAVGGGPFQGFRIDLGGAFAAYFALVLVILFTKNTVWDPPPPAFQVWTVTGTIENDKGEPFGVLGPEDISLLPPSQTLSNGWFTIDIPVKPGQGGTTDFPYLFLSHQGFGTVSVDLDPSSKPPDGITFDAANHTVRIADLRLPPLAAYQPTAPLNGQAGGNANAGQTQSAGGH